MQDFRLVIVAILLGFRTWCERSCQKLAIIMLINERKLRSVNAEAVMFRLGCFYVCVSQENTRAARSSQIGDIRYTPLPPYSRRILS
jgi:hypothetical protein